MGFLSDPVLIYSIQQSSANNFVYNRNYKFEKGTAISDILLTL